MHFRVPKTLLVFALTAVVAGCNVHAQQADPSPDPQVAAAVTLPDPPTCNLETIQGDYAFTIEGEIVQNVNGATVIIPVLGIARTHFDGAGHLDQVDFVNHNFTIAPGWRPSTGGSYTVDGNCTGKFTIEFGDNSQISTNFVIANNGKEIHTIVTSPNTMIHSDGVKM